MGIKKRILFLGLLLLLIMPMVFALDTPIKVTTQPNYAVTIRALDVAGTGTLEGGEFLDQVADENGVVEVVFSSETVNKLEVSIMVKNGVGGSLIQFEGGPVQVFNNNGEHIKSGWPVEIDTTVNPPIMTKSGKPAGTESEIATTDTGAEDSIEVSLNVTEEADSEVIEEEIIEDQVQAQEEIQEQTNPGITGEAILDGGSIFASWITYVVIGVILVILIIIFIFIKKNQKSEGIKKENSSGYKVTKLSEMKKQDTEKKEMSESEEIADAEKKLDEARRELEEVKQKNQKQEEIQKAKEQFEKDKARLEALEK